MPTTSLVTGGAGFIGSHVAEHLLRRDHQVIVLDDLSGGSFDNVPDGCTFVEGSVTDPTTVDLLFANHCIDYVFHLAAYAAEGLSHFIKRFNYTNNVIGSVNLINAAVNAGTVKCFVFTSSIAVYGTGELPLREALTPRPEDPYGIAKLAVELELRATAEMFGLPSIVFRPHNVYGERQNIGDTYRNVIGIFMNQVLLGRPLTIFGDGHQTRAFTYIDAVAGPIARSVEIPAAYHRTFNVGGDATYSINDLATAVAVAMDASIEIEHLPARNEVVHAYADHTLARETFGSLTDDIGLEAGLRRMADWARGHGPADPTVFEAIEVTANMPPSWRALVGTTATTPAGNS